MKNQAIIICRFLIRTVSPLVVMLSLVTGNIVCTTAEITILEVDRLVDRVLDDSEGDSGYTHTIRLVVYTLVQSNGTICAVYIAYLVNKKKSRRTFLCLLCVCGTMN